MLNTSMASQRSLRMASGHWSQYYILGPRCLGMGLGRVVCMKILTRPMLQLVATPIDNSLVGECLPVGHHVGSKEGSTHTRWEYVRLRCLWWACSVCGELAAATYPTRGVAFPEGAQSRRASGKNDFYTLWRISELYPTPEELVLYYRVTMVMYDTWPINSH